jgi:hypothetical protein
VYVLVYERHKFIMDAQGLVVRNKYIFVQYFIFVFLHRLNKQNPTVIVYIHVYKVYTVKVDIFKSEKFSLI